MKIVTYDNQYKEDFKRLSLNWIKKYFSLEPEDLDTLENIEQLIHQGAMIFFAVEDNQVMATCMVRPLDNNTWEIGKLSTDENFLGRGAGSAVFKAGIDYARKNSAKKVVLYSHTSLQPAIKIYKKFDFIEVPVKNSEYKRCNYQAELELN